MSGIVAAGKAKNIPKPPPVISFPIQFLRLQRKRQRKMPYMERESMRTIVTAILLVFSLTSVTAFACPKGTHLVGGTGPHHKGGKCVAADGKASDAKSDAKAADTKSEAKADVKSSKKKSKKKAAEAAK